MNLIAELAIIASVIQISYQILKKLILERFLQPIPDWVDQISVLLLSLITAFTLKADLLALLVNIRLLVDLSHLPPWVGQLLFALLISKGSSSVHELHIFLERKRQSVLTLDSTSHKPKKQCRFW